MPTSSTAELTASEIMETTSLWLDFLHNRLDLAEVIAHIARCQREIRVLAEYPSRDRKFLVNEKVALADAIFEALGFPVGPARG